MKTVNSLSIVLLSFMGFQANAGFDFQPIIASVAPSGQAATTSFTVTNSENSKLAVEVNIVNREPDINGKEVYKESDKIDELFRVYPNNLVLGPKESRTVRVTYIGNQQVKTELAFRIIAEELPIDLDDPNKAYTKPVAKITLSTKYIGSLYVTPPAAKPQINIDAKKSETASNDLILDVSNAGSAHQIYKNPTVKILSKVNGKEITLQGDDVKPLMSQNILAGFSRRFVLPWPKDLAPGPLKVAIESPQE